MKSNGICILDEALFEPVNVWC